MKFRRSLVTGLALVIPVAVMALPPMGKDFIAAAKISPDSKLAKSDCAICHVGRTPKLNPYGTDMKAAMAALKSRRLHPPYWRRLRPRTPTRTESRMWSR